MLQHGPVFQQWEQHKVSFLLKVMGATQGRAGGGSCCIAPGKSKNNGMLSGAAGREVPASVQGPGQGWVCAQHQGNKMCLSLPAARRGRGMAAFGTGEQESCPGSQGDKSPASTGAASQGSPSWHWGLAGSGQHKEARKGSGQFWESHSAAVNWVHFGRQSSLPKAATSRGCAQCGAVQDLLLSCGSGGREMATRTQLPSQRDMAAAHLGQQTAPAAPKSLLRPSSPPCCSSQALPAGTGSLFLCQLLRVPVRWCCGQGRGNVPLTWGEGAWGQGEASVI